MFGIPKISNEEYISTLTEINGVAPETWFIALNSGKAKKETYGFLVNSIGDNLQLVPIKKNKKVFSLDKENIINLPKEDYFSKTTCVVDDTHDHFNICLTNGNKYKTIIKKYIIDKNRRKKYKSFRKQFKKQSVISQILNILLTILYSILALLIMTFCIINIPNNSIYYKHYQMAKVVRTYIEDGKYQKIPFKPYDKGNLNLDEDSRVVETEFFRFNLPKGYKEYVDPDFPDKESSFVIYSYETETSKKKILVDKEGLKGGDFTEFDENYSNACENKFGFRIDSKYNFNKIKYCLDYNSDKINYFDRDEVALHFGLGIINNLVGYDAVYEIETETYKGFIYVVNESLNLSNAIIKLEAYSKKDLNTSYSMSIIVGNSEIDEAYKIINSVELIVDEKEKISEINEKFEQAKAMANSSEYKDLLSIKIQPYKSDAVVKGNTKTVELKSFRFTVNEKSEFYQMDSGDSYIYTSGNKIIAPGYVKSYNYTEKINELNTTINPYIKNGFLEKLGYSHKNCYERVKSGFSVDFFSEDIDKLNSYEKKIYSTLVSSRIENHDDVIAVYEKEFESYYMIVHVSKYQDMSYYPVYAYGVLIFFKDDLNSFEQYCITSQNCSQEECFAIINSMELIEE